MCEIVKLYKGKLAKDAGKKKKKRTGFDLIQRNTHFLFLQILICRIHY